MTQRRRLATAALGVLATTSALALSAATPSAANPLTATEQGLIGVQDFNYSNCQPDLSCTGPASSSPGTFESSRDCGWSTPVGTNQRLWIFCDTDMYTHAVAGDAPTKVSSFINSSAGLASGATPAERANVSATLVNNQPWQFINSSPAGTCDVDYPGSYYAAWPQSTTTLTGMTNTGGAEIVAVMFQQFCVRPNSFDPLKPPFEGRDTGIAFFAYNADGYQQLPPAATYGWFGLTGSVLNYSLFSNTPNTYGFQFGLTQQTSADGTHLYATRCVQLVSCDIARVALTGDWNGTDKNAIATTTDWTFQSSSGSWLAFDGVTKAPTTATKPLWTTGSAPAADPAIVWNPSLSRYVMTYLREGYTEKAAMRTSLTPVGPWSDPVDFELPANCLVAASSAIPYNGCYQIIAQPQLDSAGTIAISYFDVNDLVVNDPAQGIGRLHWATLPTSSVPAAPTPVTVTVDFGSGVRSIATRTSAFRVLGTATPGSTVTVSVDGGPSATATVQPTGAFTFNGSAPAGLHSVVTQACQGSVCATDQVSVTTGSTVKVSPILECVATTATGHEARFGYNNPGPLAMQVFVGNQNRFTSLPNDRGQPTLFLLGRKINVFATPIGAGNTVWSLTAKTATATPTSKACTTP
jgi:hypothetical protein